jgi:hypothetical protein
MLCRHLSNRTGLDWNERYLDVDMACPRNREWPAWFILQPEGDRLADQEHAFKAAFDESGDGKVGELGPFNASTSGLANVT